MNTIFRSGASSIAPIIRCHAANCHVGPIAWAQSQRLDEACRLICGSLGPAADLHDRLKALKIFDHFTLGVAPRRLSNPDPKATGGRRVSEDDMDPRCVR